MHIRWIAFICIISFVPGLVSGVTATLDSSGPAFYKMLDDFVNSPQFARVQADMLAALNRMMERSRKDGNEARMSLEKVRQAVADGHASAQDIDFAHVFNDHALLCDGTEYIDLSSVKNGISRGHIYVMCKDKLAYCSTFGLCVVQDLVIEQQAEDVFFRLSCQAVDKESKATSKWNLAPNHLTRNDALVVKFFLNKKKEKKVKVAAEAVQLQGTKTDGSDMRASSSYGKMMYGVWAVEAVLLVAYLWLGGRASDDCNAGISDTAKAPITSSMQNSTSTLSPGRTGTAHATPDNSKSGASTGENLHLAATRWTVVVIAIAMTLI